MVSKCVLALLLTAVIGICSADGGTHHKIIIHVPYKIKHHHHTHTIYKHIKEEKKEHKEHKEHEEEHKEHPHHEEKGKDHYEFLGYTIGKPKHEESSKKGEGKGHHEGISFIGHKGFGESGHKEHKSHKSHGGLFGSHSFGESKIITDHEKKGLGNFGAGHGKLFSDYVGKLSGQSSYKNERASLADNTEGFEKHGEIVKSLDGTHTSQFFGSKAGYDLLKQSNGGVHSIDHEIK